VGVAVEVAQPIDRHIYMCQAEGSHIHSHTSPSALTTRLNGPSQSLKCMRVPTAFCLQPSALCRTQLKMCITRKGRLFGGRQRFGSSCLPSSPATNGPKSVYPSANPSVRRVGRSVGRPDCPPG